MAATLPTKQIHFPFTKWSFSLNPGPFNLKEHVLITIFASCGAGDVSAVGLITILKIFYRRGLNPIAATLLVQTTQVLIIFTSTCLVLLQHGIIGTKPIEWLSCVPSHVSNEFSYWDMDGLVYSENIWLTPLTCGGRLNWFKSLCFGTNLSLSC